jgi:hypothetical protein
MRGFFLSGIFLRGYFSQAIILQMALKINFEEGEEIKIFFNLLQLQNIIIIIKLRTCIDILKERDFN